MEIITKIKSIAECIAAIDTAIITLAGLIHFIKPIKKFITKIIRPFFLGVKNASGKRVFCFAAIKEQKEQQKQFNNIIDALTKDYEEEDIIILNKKELINFLCESKIISTMKRRK